MKIPFTLEAWLKDTSQEVIDENGRPVRIICTDADGFYPIIGLVDNKIPLPCGKNGRPPYIGGGGGTLFIVTPEPELTDWEKFISGCLQKHGLLDCGGADRIAKECSSELLELARKELEPEVLERLEAAYKNQDEVVYENGKRDGKAEALKDFPRWKKIKAFDVLPCRAYLYNLAYERKNNFGGIAITIHGLLMPNEAVKVGCDTWYLPVDDIQNLPKED